MVAAGTPLGVGNVALLNKAIYQVIGDNVLLFTSFISLRYKKWPLQGSLTTLFRPHASLVLCILSASWVKILLCFIHMHLHIVIEGVFCRPFVKLTWHLLLGLQPAVVIIDESYRLCD